MAQLNASTLSAPETHASRWRGTTIGIGLWTLLVLVDQVVPEFSLANVSSLLDDLIPHAVWSRALCMKGALFANGRLLLWAWIVSSGVALQTAIAAWNDSGFYRHVLDRAASNAARLSRNANSIVRLMSWQFIAIVFGVGYLMWYYLLGSGPDVTLCNLGVGRDVFAQGAVIVLTGSMSAWMGVMLVRGVQKYWIEERHKRDAIPATTGWNTDAIAAQAGRIHCAVSLCALLLAAAICFGMTDNDVLSSPGIQAFIAHVARVVPGVYTVASVTEHPPVAQFAFATQWLFMPVHFALFLIATPVWGETTKAKQLAIIKRRRAAGQGRRYVLISVCGGLAFLTLVLSDLQIMHMFSLVTGEAFLEKDAPILAFHRHSTPGVMLMALLLPLMDAVEWLALPLTWRALWVYLQSAKKEC